MLESFVNVSIDFTKSILTFLKILIGSKLTVKNHKTKEENIIVIGNGPSLKEVVKNDLNDLENQVLLGVNNLPSTEIFEQLKPSYFIVVSEEFWKPGQIKKHQKVRDDIIENLIKKTTWPLVFFLPYTASRNKNFIQNIGQNKNIEISYFNKTPIEGLVSMNHFFMKRGWGMPRPHNVLVPSIYCCIQAGFKNMFLIGADHSWIPLISVDENNNALINQKHFYDDDKDNKEAMHYKSKPRKLHHILEKFMLSFKAYFVLKDYAYTRGVNIYNCTPGSFIDAFDRRNLSDVFKMSKQNQPEKIKI